MNAQVIRSRRRRARRYSPTRWWSTALVVGLCVITGLIVAASVCSSMAATGADLRSFKPQLAVTSRRLVFTSPCRLLFGLAS